MIIGYPRKTNKAKVHEPLKMNDCYVKGMTNTESLGIIVGEGLNWERQFNTVHDKSSGGLESLKRLKNILPHFSLSKVYRALVESQMLYANITWDSLSSSKWNPFNVSQTEQFL